MNRYQELMRKLRLELEVKKYAQSTIDTYSSCLGVFLKAMNGKPAPLDLEEIKKFLVTIKKQNYHKQFTATIHHFYRLVLKQPLSLQDIPYPRKTHYLPQIFSVQEIAATIQQAANIKHRAILQLMYSCALRIGETVNIELHHVDSQRYTLLVKGAKGFKDRYVPLPAATIELLRNYYTVFKPKKYLFEGQYGGQYDVRSIQQFFHKYKNLAGIKKKLTPHSIRHSRLTHLKEAGVDIYELKEIAGHNQIQTTEIYLHLASHSLVSRVAMADALITQSLQHQLP
jgi:site-specific recombinase XerD